MTLRRLRPRVPSGDLRTRARALRRAAAGPREVKTPDDNSVALAVSPRTVLNEQAMWMGGLTEYSEAASTVGAIGIVGGIPVEMEGVGYCEGVGFEDPAETHTRAKTWLRAALGEPGSPP